MEQTHVCSHFKSSSYVVVYLVTLHLLLKFHSKILGQIDQA
ncbi:hypothetical protein NC652_028582 [Populus alba x Populus x berolinensis]|nr:hypothetical protein NC652_028582 [Populus alba x Populus x berolinensis]